MLKFEKGTTILANSEDEMPGYTIDAVGEKLSDGHIHVIVVYNNKTLRDDILRFLQDNPRPYRVGDV